VTKMIMGVVMVSMGITWSVLDYFAPHAKLSSDIVTLSIILFVLFGLSLIAFGSDDLSKEK